MIEEPAIDLSEPEFDKDRVMLREVIEEKIE
jgi:hypothetical protein